MKKHMCREVHVLFKCRGNVRPAWGEAIGEVLSCISKKGEDSQLPSSLSYHFVNMLE